MDCCAAAVDEVKVPRREARLMNEPVCSFQKIERSAEAFRDCHVPCPPLLG